MDFQEYISRLKSSSNYRSIPDDTSRAGILDLSTNDYMGFAGNGELLESFINNPDNLRHPFTSSASRLLSASQDAYHALESFLEEIYGRPSLLFNSGYHANTGLIPALCDTDTVILADKLVHASIIDGIKLSGCKFERFRHNDVAHLLKLAAKYPTSPLLILAESIYSMDGDTAPLARLVEFRRSRPDTMLYIDEAHAVGAFGTRGLGLCASLGMLDEVDIVVGTFGKALASQGAFAVLPPLLKEVAVNKARSFIFSTAIPPFAAAWTLHVLRHAVGADEDRLHLKHLAGRMHTLLQLPGNPDEATHIIPYIVGDSARTLSLSHKLLENGVKILPIRTPTVPPGTERLRISLNASLSESQVDKVAELILSLSHE